MSKKIVTVGSAATTPSSSTSGGQRSIQTMIQQEKEKESTQTIIQMLQKMDQQQQKMEQQLIKTDEKVQGMEQQLLKTNEKVVNIQQITTKYEERLVNLEERDGKKEEKIKEIESRLGEVEQGAVGLLGWEMDRAEFYLRFQNVQEDKGEDLPGIMIAMLSDALDISKEKMMDGIDKIYRVHTAYVMQHKLPREVHIRFTRKSIKTQILQAAFSKHFLNHLF